MKPRNRAAGAIVVLVVLWGMAAAGAFVVLGSQIAVYVAGSIVPLLVVFAAVWANGVVGSTGSGEDKIAKQQARSVGNEFEGLWADYREAQKRFPEYFEEDSLQIDQIVSKLDDNGVSFDPESGTTSVGGFSLLSRPDIEQLSSISEDIAELETELLRNVETATEIKIDDWESDVGRIAEFVDEKPSLATGFDPESIESPSDAYRELDEIEGTLQRRLEAAIDELRMLSPSSLDELDSATEALERHAYSDAIDHLITAKRSIESEGKEELLGRRKALLDIVETIESTDVPFRGELDRGMDDFDSYQSQLRAMDDLTDLPDLETLEEEIREETRDLLTELTRCSEAARETLESESVPDGFYTLPPELDDDVVETVQTAESTTEFAEEFQRTFALVVDRANALQPKAEVVEAYESVAGNIDELLEERGRVEPEDVPVREYGVEFLKLHAANREELRFDESVEALVYGGEDATHDVSVLVTVAPDIDQIAVDVTLEGDRYELSKQNTVADLGKVIFERIPDGEYELRIDPDAVHVESERREIAVDEDRSISVDLSSRPELLSLCDGLDDPATLLDDLGDRFATRFDEDGTLTHSMEFPVDDEAVDCLLAQWAIRNGVEFTTTDGGVIVYDRDVLLEELRNVAKHNLDTYERIDFDALRERYLSSPVPDETIEAASDEIAALGVSEGELQKTE